jgi:hypothetical protein
LNTNMPDFLADVPLIIRRELHFMHDGAVHIYIYIYIYIFNYSKSQPGCWRLTALLKSGIDNVFSSANCLEHITSSAWRGVTANNLAWNSQVETNKPTELF